MGGLEEVCFWQLNNFFFFLVFVGRLAGKMALAHGKPERGKTIDQNPTSTEDDHTQ